jgi:hypothetical protein
MTVVEHASRAEAAPRADPEPASASTESTGVVAVVMDFVGATLAQFDQLLERLRLSPDGAGRVGRLFQWSRSTPDGVRVTEVWQSQGHFEVFLRERIEPHLSDAGLREPEVTTYDVHSYLTGVPAVAPQAGDRSDRNLEL